MSPRAESSSAPDPPRVHGSGCSVQHGEADQCDRLRVQPALPRLCLLPAHLPHAPAQQCAREGPGREGALRLRLKLILKHVSNGGGKRRHPKASFERATGGGGGLNGALQRRTCGAYDRLL